MYVYLSLYIYIHVYVYIYIYIEREIHTLLMFNNQCGEHFINLRGLLTRGGD